MKFPLLNHSSPSRPPLHWRLGIVWMTAAAVAVPASTARADSISRAKDTSCPLVSSSQVFLPWLDEGFYEFATNGGFEERAKKWLLSGGAQVTAGNESFFVHSSTDNYALHLPDGSSALSSPVCIGLTRPAFRVFTSNAGTPTSLLDVEVIYQGRLGVLAVLNGGTIVADSPWAPTPRLLMLEPPAGSISVQIQFTPVGSGGDWRIDDLYIDPFNSV
jgi:hypothetical protein